MEVGCRLISLSTPIETQVSKSRGGQFCEECSASEYHFILTSLSCFSPVVYLSLKKLSIFHLAWDC